MANKKIKIAQQKSRQKLLLREKTGKHAMALMKQAIEKTAVAIKNCIVNRKLDRKKLSKTNN